MGLVRRGVTSRLTFQFGRFNRVGQANCYPLGGWSEGEWLVGSGAIVQGYPHSLQWILSLLYKTNPCRFVNTVMVCPVGALKLPVFFTLAFVRLDQVFDGRKSGSSATHGPSLR